MRLTKAGVCYDLTNSPFSHTIEYDGQTVKYFFSSDNNVRRFKEKLEDNRSNINSSLSNRFKFVVEADLIADIRLYLNVESRGFYIFVDGKVLEWHEDIRLNGLKIKTND